MELDRRNMKRTAFLIAFGVAFYMALKNLYQLSNLISSVLNVIGPVLAGCAIAFVVNVLMVQVETRLFPPLNRRFRHIWPKFRRGVSILLSVVLIVGLLALILLIIIPGLVRTITSLTDHIPDFFNNLQDSVTKVYQKHPEIAEYFRNVNIDWTSVSQLLAGYGQKLAENLVSSTVTVTTGLFHGMISCVLSLVISLNVLAQKEKLCGQAKTVLYAYLPQKRADSVYHIFHLTNRAFYNFIAGTCTEACILSTLCFIGMNLFHFPYALLVSVFVFFMDFIPILGSFFSSVVGALLILIVSPLQALWYIVFFNVLQQLEGNLIYPRVVGSRVGLPALWVLVAVTIGANTLGVLGMVISVPICSVLYALLREDVKRRQKRGNPGGAAFGSSEDSKAPAPENAPSPTGKAAGPADR